MKRAVKIIFGIALGCFLLGCVVLGIGIATGGTIKEFAEAVKNNKFALQWDFSGWGSKEEEADTDETSFAVEDVKALDIDIDAGMLKIVKGNGKEIKVTTISKNATIETNIQSGTLQISEVTGHTRWKVGDNNRLQVVIEVPEKLELKKLQMEVGAGDINIEEGLLSTEYAEFDVDAGNLNFSGEVKGDIDVSCDVGNMELKLAGSQQDYNYALSCDVGSVKVGDISVSGLGREREVDNGADYDMDVSCDVGNIDVTFEE